MHRRQITFDWVDRATGQAQRGQITPATAEVLGRWLAQLPCHDGAFAVEACTGWRFVVEALQAAGWHAYLAEPAETASLRGPKRRAKTDRTDAQLADVVKSTRTSNSSVVDHLLSTFVFVAFLVEFLLVKGAAHSVFFTLMLIALVDVLSGFSVSIRAAGRDVNLS